LTLIDFSLVNSALSADEVSAY